MPGAMPYLEFGEKIRFNLIIFKLNSIEASLLRNSPIRCRPHVLPSPYEPFFPTKKSCLSSSFIYSKRLNKKKGKKKIKMKLKFKPKIMMPLANFIIWCWLQPRTPKECLTVAHRGLVMGIHEITWSLIEYWIVIL